MTLSARAKGGWLLREAKAEAAVMDHSPRVLSLFHFRLACNTLFGEVSTGTTGVEYARALLPFDSGGDGDLQYDRCWTNFDM